MSTNNIRSSAVGLVALIVTTLSVASPANAQTISGRLMEAGSDRFIPLGQMVLVYEGGDTVDVTYTDDNGFFTLSHDLPGDYLVLADALGYGAMAAGVFELGEGASMTIEYRMNVFALPIENLIVEFDRPVMQHSLVRNGFVARFNRGVGHFITPYMIENSSALRTEDLFRNIPDVSVRPIGGGLGSFLGDAVRLRTPGGDWCDPLLYLDGMRTENNPEMGMTLGVLAPKQQIEGIEVYRRQAEIPLEYGIGVATAGSTSNSPANFCGVIVIWTKNRFSR